FELDSIRAALEDERSQGAAGRARSEADKRTIGDLEQRVSEREALLKALEAQLKTETEAKDGAVRRAQAAEVDSESRRRDSEKQIQETREELARHKADLDALRQTGGEQHAALGEAQRAAQQKETEHQRELSDLKTKLVEALT